MSPDKDQADEVFFGFGHALQEQKATTDASRIVSDVEASPQKRMPTLNIVTAAVVEREAEYASRQIRSRGRMARPRTNRTNQLSLKLSDETFHGFWSFAEQFGGDGERTVEALLYYASIGLVRSEKS